MLFALIKNIIVVYSIDATVADECCGSGRYINHSKNNCNLKGKLIKDFNNKYHLCFISKHNIKKGEELLIDYGDRRRDVVKHFNWLKQ
jgi:histone-lysine N-methyltransferase SETD8